MGNRLVCSVFIVVAVFALSPLVLAEIEGQAGSAATKVQARSIPRTSEGKTDLSGVWVKGPVTEPWQRFQAGFTKEPVPMQSWAKERFDYFRNPGDPEGLEYGRVELEPVWNCLPPSPTMLMLNPAGMFFELFQSPKRILTLHRGEYDRWIREIWTDGRKHPDDLISSWMGHSIGTWDGDTFVVDTIGIKDTGGWLDRAGHLFTEALHVVERLRRIDYDTLENDLLFDDPKVYTKPWGAKIIYKLQPNREIEGSSVPCEEKIERRY